MEEFLSTGTGYSQLLTAQKESKFIIIWQKDLVLLDLALYLF